VSSYSETELPRQKALETELWTVRTNKTYTKIVRTIAALNLGGEIVNTVIEAPRFLSIFLLGRMPEIMGRNKARQDKQISEVLKRYGLSEEWKLLVRKDKDLLKINIREADGYIIFPYVLQRFAPLIYLVETGKPIIVVSEEENFMHALEAYDYLSDHRNIQLVFSPEELQEKLQALKVAEWFEDYRICLFDDGNWTLDGIAWQKNPLFMGKLNIHHVTPLELVDAISK